MEPRQDYPPGAPRSRAEAAAGALDLLEIGELQAIKERLARYRAELGDSLLVQDLDFLVSRLEKAAILIFELLDGA